MGKIMLCVWHEKLAYPTGAPTDLCKQIAALDPPPDYIDAPAYDLAYDSWNWAALNLTPQVMSLLQNRGIKVLAHIAGTGQYMTNLSPTGAHVPDWLTQTKPQIDRALACGVDGIFDGEIHIWDYLIDPVTAPDPLTPSLMPFYQTYSDYVKSKSRLVFFNTGYFGTSEQIMSLCDVVSLEQAWYRFAHRAEDPLPNGAKNWNPLPAWKQKYSNDRFMGIASTFTTKDDAIAQVNAIWNEGYGIVGVDGISNYSWWQDWYATLKPKPQGTNTGTIAVAAGLLGLAGIAAYLLTR